MHLKTLSVLNFKNYTETSLEFDREINCLTGENGQGKTNILDAVYYLSFCKSFFNPIDSQNILHNAPFFMIQGVFDLHGNEEEIYCAQKRNQKKIFKRNKKEYSRLADHIGLFPVVMISPADSELITEGSESRRKFIDSVIAQYDREYLDALIHYNRILSQRNALLKQISRTGKFDADSLAIWDEQIVPAGKSIFEKRKEFIHKFITIFQEYYEFISGGNETVDLYYKSHLSENDFQTLLNQSFNRDSAMEYTTTGIHKDDLEFKLNGYPLKKFASQGQQKSYLLALRLAQYEFIRKIKNTPPVLLLDDIHDKLDESRMRKLLRLIAGEQFGQIFITDTHPERLSQIFIEDGTAHKNFIVQNGSVTETRKHII